MALFSRLNKLSLQLPIDLFPQTSRGFLFPYFSHTHTKHFRTTLIVMTEMTSKFSKPQVAPQGQSFAHNVKWRLISMFDKNINHGKLFVGITKIKGK